MSKELFWLSLTLIVTALLAFPYVLNRIYVRGLWVTMANPSSGLPAQSPWAERAKLAHANAIENLVLFSPAVIVVAMLNAGNSSTVFACKLYFFSRVIHYIVYAAGIPVLRTLAFLGGWVGIAILCFRMIAVV